MGEEKKNRPSTCQIVEESQNNGKKKLTHTFFLYFLFILLHIKNLLLFSRGYK